VEGVVRFHGLDPGMSVEVFSAHEHAVGKLQDLSCRVVGVTGFARQGTHLGEGGHAHI